MALKPHEFRERLKGVVHLVMTPFDDQGEVDEQALRLGLRKVVNECRGEDVTILALGSTGEFYALNDKENRRVAEIVVDEINGVFPVMIGTARAGTRYTIEESRFAQQIGADAVMVVHPYYAMPTEEEVVRHYEEVAASIDIAVCIYNNPVTSKLWLPPETIERLSNVDNIVALKENTSNPMAFLKMMQTLDKNKISIFAGLGHMMYQFMYQFGCTGFVTELLNFAPHLALGLYKAGQQRDIDKVRQIVDTIELLWDFIRKVAASRSRIPSVLTPAQTPVDMPFYQAVNKAAMDLTGTPGGKVRAPMSNLTEEEIRELRNVLIQMGCQVV